MEYAVYKIARSNEQGFTVFGTQDQAEAVAKIVSDASDAAGFDLAMPTVTLTDDADADYDAADYITDAAE